MILLFRLVDYLFPLTNRVTEFLNCSWNFSTIQSMIQTGKKQSKWEMWESKEKGGPGVSAYQKFPENSAANDCKDPG